MSYIFTKEQEVNNPSGFCSSCNHMVTFQSVWDERTGDNSFHAGDRVFFFYKCPNCKDLIILKLSSNNLMPQRCEKGNVYTFYGSEEDLIYPVAPEGPGPNADMPADVKDDYEEARQVAQFSSRAAAALLRLALEKLCENITGEKVKDINATIEKLVAQGLSEDLQHAFDIVRITGNKSVHPGELNLDDNPEIVAALYECINTIVEEKIARPKRFKSIYDKMPESDRAKVAKRDGKAKA